MSYVCIELSQLNQFTEIISLALLAGTRHYLPLTHSLTDRFKASKSGVRNLYVVPKRVSSLDICERVGQAIACMS